jgi:cytochrome c-type biogenesis protein CcmF
MESFTSRESGFLFNNMVFVVMCFSVFWGTLFPVISEAVRGTKITVGPPFFNQINIPIGLILLGLTGVGPLLAWRRTGKKNLIRNFTFPILTGLSSAIILLIIGFRDYVVISFSLGAFVTATITTEFIRGIRARNKKFKESPFVALKMMVSKNRSRYGGYVVHLGIVFMFIGFTGHAFDKEKEFSLKVGETDHVAGYEFELIQLSESERPNHYAWISDLRVTNHNGEFVTNLNPEKRVYFHRNPDVNRRQPHSELDIYSTLNKDIYSIFSAVDTENGVAFIKIMVNPLVRWVYFGFWYINCPLASERFLMEIIGDYGLILIFFVVAVIFVLQPLFLSDLGKIVVELDINVLKRKKLLLYRQIKELEMEYEIGNINDEDFDSNRALLKQEVSAIITALDSK